MSLQFCPYYGRLYITMSDGNYRMMRLRCKRWACPYCARINARVWQGRSIEHMNRSDKSWAFITLTPHPSTVQKHFTADVKNRLALSNLRGGFDRLRKRWKRQFPDLEYLRVFERFENGGLHMHIIGTLHYDDIKAHKKRSKSGAIVYYSQTLKDEAIECGMGWRTAYAALPREHSWAVFYVTKYVSKELMARPPEIGRVRMIQTTKGWYKPASKSSDDAFTVSFVTPEILYRCGGQITDSDTGEIITRDKLDDALQVYPHPTEPLELQSEYPLLY